MNRLTLSTKWTSENRHKEKGEGIGGWGESRSPDTDESNEGAASEIEEPQHLARRHCFPLLSVKNVKCVVLLIQIILFQKETYLNKLSKTSI